MSDQRTEKPEERGHDGLTTTERIAQMLRAILVDPRDERIASLTAENATLRQRVERLTRPVDIDELTTCLDEKQKVHGPESIQAWFDRLIRARATEGQEEGKTDEG